MKASTIWLSVILLALLFLPGCKQPHQPETLGYADFETPQELMSFLDSDKTDKIPVRWTKGDLTVRLHCMNYAEILRDKFHEAGYHANIQISDNGSYIHGDVHAMVSVVVGTDIWIIDPITDECWKAWPIRQIELSINKRG